MSSNTPVTHWVSRSCCLLVLHLQLTSRCCTNHPFRHFLLVSPALLAVSPLYLSPPKGCEDSGQALCGKAWPSPFQPSPYTSVCMVTHLDLLFDSAPSSDLLEVRHDLQVAAPLPRGPRSQIKGCYWCRLAKVKCHCSSPSPKCHQVLQIIAFNFGGQLASSLFPTI